MQSVTNSQIICVMQYAIGIAAKQTIIPSSVSIINFPKAGSGMLTSIR